MGLIKTVFDADSRGLLGAHLLEPEVTELIHSYVVVRGSELSEEDLFHTIYPHPTIAEGFHESVLAAYDRAVLCTSEPGESSLLSGAERVRLAGR